MGLLGKPHISLAEGNSPKTPSEGQSFMLYRRDNYEKLFNGHQNVIKVG